VSRWLAYKQLHENQREGSILNYAERLVAIQSLFDLSARKLATRVLALRRAVVPLYGINIRFVSPARYKMIDTIAEWLLRLQDEMQKYHSKQKTSIFSVSIADWLAERHQTVSGSLQPRGSWT
jgi:hypothetical protein